MQRDRLIFTFFEPKRLAALVIGYFYVVYKTTNVTTINKEDVDAVTESVKSTMAVPENMFFSVVAEK